MGPLSTNAFVPQGLYDPEKEDVQPEWNWNQQSHPDNQYIQSAPVEGAFVPQGLYDPYAEEDQRRIEGQTNLAKEIASPKYWIEGDLEKAMEIPKHQREEFLGYLKQQALIQREDNKDRGILEGMGDAFNYARGRSMSAINQFADTLGAGFTSDEDWQFAHEIQKIRGGYTDPGNQGIIQGALEGAAGFVPDIIGSIGAAGIGSLGGPAGAAAGGFAYWEAVTASSLENEMADLDITPAQRKAISVLGASPVAGLEYLKLGFLAPPLKTALTKSVQKVGADYAKKYVGNLGKSKVAQAVGRYGSDYTLNMTQEYMQAVTETAVMSLAKTLEQGEVNDEVIAEAKEQYRQGMIGLWDAALPMATLIGGSRAVGNVTKIPDGVKFLADKTDVQLDKWLSLNAEKIKKIIGKEGIPSRSEIRAIGEKGATNAAKRELIQDELRQIAEANPEVFDTPAPATPATMPFSGQQEVVGGYALPGQQDTSASDGVSEFIERANALGPGVEPTEHDYNQRNETQADDDISFDVDSFEEGSDTFDDSFDVASFEAELNDDPASVPEDDGSGFAAEAKEVSLEQVTDTVHYEKLEEVFKKEKAPTLQKRMDNLGIKIDKDVFGNKVNNEARIHSLMKYEKSIDDVSKDYGIDSLLAKELVEDSWAARQAALENMPYQEQISNYIEPSKHKTKGKWVEGGAIFGIGADLYNMKGRAGLNKARALVKKLKTIVGQESTSKQNPSLEGTKQEAFSLLAEMDANQWPGLDEMADGIERNGLGTVPSDTNPSDWAKEQILQYIHDKTFPVAKGSREFIEAAVSRYAENVALASGAEFTEPSQEEGGRKVLGFAGAFGLTRDYTPNRKLESTPIQAELAKILGPAMSTRMGQANGLNVQGAISYVWDSMKDGLSQLLKKREHLDMKTQAGMEVRSALRLLEGRMRNSTGRVFREISAVLRELHKPEKELFERLLVLEDMKSHYDLIQSKAAFRFGIESIQELERKLDGVRKLVSESPQVTDALKRRERIITPVVKRLVEQELIPKESLDNPMAYFHRQVMIHQQASWQQRKYEKKYKRIPASSSGMNLSLQEQELGFQKSRRTDKLMMAQEYDYNTNYIQSEFEWLAQSEQQLLHVEFMEWVGRKFDNTKKLEKQAKYENTVKWFGGKRKYKAIMDARGRAAELDAAREAGQLDKAEYGILRPPLTAFIGKNDPSVSFRQKMATAISKTNKLLDEYGIGTDIYDYNEFFGEVLEDRSEIFGHNQAPDQAKMYAGIYLKAMGEQQKAMALAVGGKDGVKGVDYVTLDKIVERDDKFGHFLALPGNRFYTVSTITEATAEKIAAAAMANMKLVASDINVREQFAVGKNKPLILPVDIANEFNSMEKLDKPKGFLMTALKAATTEFKKIALLSPGRLAGYVIRNKIGDTEAMFMGTFGDGASKYIMQAKDLAWNLKKYQDDIADAKAKGEKLEPKLQKISNLIDQLVRLDIIGSSAATLELSRTPELKRFDSTKHENFAAAGLHTFAKIYNGYFDWAGDKAEFSENWTRIVAYLNYQEKLSKGEQFSYGGSDRKYVDTIRKEFGDDVAAGQLARDLLGDYGETSIMVDKMSQTFIPFAKFQGINVERMLRIAKNNAIDTKEGLKNGKVVSPAMTAARIALPYAAMMMWNKVLFSDEEDDLAAYDRANPHIILGHRPDGSLMVLRNFSVSGDFLEWFGLNSIGTLVRKYLDGKIGIDDAAWEMAKDPMNKIAGSVTPLFKAPVEALYGKSSFPDVTKPRPVARDVALASSIMSPESYRWLKGTLSGSGERARPGHYEDVNWLGVSISSVKDNALNDTYGLITSYKDSKGIPVPNYASSATKNMKRAVQFQDYQSFLKAKKAFIANGGDADKFLRSIRNYDPVDRMNDEQEQEFMNEYVNEYDKEKVHIARDYVKRIQGTMWSWWAKSEGTSEAGKLPEVFESRVKSKLTKFGSKHGKDSKTDWNVEYKETAEWLKERNITLNESVAFLKEYYQDKKTNYKTKFANLRRARKLLSEYGLK